MAFLPARPRTSRNIANPGWFQRLSLAPDHCDRDVRTQGRYTSQRNSELAPLDFLDGVDGRLAGCATHQAAVFDGLGVDVRGDGRAVSLLFYDDVHVDERLLALVRGGL